MATHPSETNASMYISPAESDPWAKDMTRQGVSNSEDLHVAIVGAGIGGLACAIACRRESQALQVTLLERSSDILSIGAGIHIPPNSCRALTRFGLLDKLKQAGGYQVDKFTLRRYKDGQILVEKPLKGRAERDYGAEWM